MRTKKELKVVISFYANFLALFQVFVLMNDICFIKAIQYRNNFYIKIKENFTLKYDFIN